MSTRILLINSHSDLNAGDLALLRATLEQIQLNFPGSQITIAVDDPINYSGKEKIVESVWTKLKTRKPSGEEYWNWFWIIFIIPLTAISILVSRFLHTSFFPLSSKSLIDLLESYLSADLIICKPGGFLYSSGKGLTLLINTYTILLGFCANKPVYLFPQSIGPFQRRWEEIFVKMVLARVRIIMVRESISLEILRSIGFSHPRCELIPDTAFSFVEKDTLFALNWLHARNLKSNDKIPLLGLTLVNWGRLNSKFTNQNNYEIAIEAAARFFVERMSGKVIIFTQVTGPASAENDLIPSLRTLKRLEQHSDSIFLYNEYNTPEKLKSLYSHMDLFIGTRMHSNIFAVCEYVPVITIGYQHKSEGIMRLLGLMDWFIPITTINDEILIGKIKEIWLKRTGIREQLKVTIPKLIIKAKQAGSLVAEDFTAK